MAVDLDEMPHESRLLRYRSLLENPAPLRREFWDAVVLTSSSREQSACFSERLDALFDSGALPGERERYVCVADPPGGRIGSGGATIRVAALLEDWFGDFWRTKKIFVLHTGGHSERAPQHGACGKAFAEIPMDAAGVGMPATVLEAQLVQLSAFAKALPPGIFVSSADVLLEYGDAPLSYDADVYEAMERGITALGHPSPLIIGSQHGVFCCDAKEVEMRMEAVRAGNDQTSLRPLMSHRCLQKPSTEAMREAGAVLLGYETESDEWVLTDSAFHIGVEACEALIALAKTKGDVLAECEVDAYGDFMQPLGRKADTSYLDRVDHLASVTSSTNLDGSERLRLARRAVAEVMRGRPLVVIPLLTSRFIHLGTIPEFLYHTTMDEKCLRLLPAPNFPVKMASYIHSSVETPPFTTIMLSSIEQGTCIGQGSCLVKCTVQEGATIGERCALYDVDLHNGAKVPPGTFMHTLPLTGGKYVTIILHVDDVMKSKTSSTVCGVLVEDAVKILRKHNALPSGGAWAVEQSHTTTLATIYRVANERYAAEQYALWMASILRNEKQEEYACPFDSSSYLSIAQALRLHANHTEMLNRQNDLHEKIITQTLYAVLDASLPADEWSNLAERRHLLEIRKRCEESFLNETSVCSELEKMIPMIEKRMYSTLLLRARVALSLRLPHAVPIAQTFLRTIITELSLSKFPQPNIRGSPFKHVTVKYPARLNFAGGWTDTPPYCLENRGCVLHVPCLVDGEMPILARASFPQDPGDKPVIRLAVRDPITGNISTEDVNTMSDLLTYNEPSSPFALHKAVWAFFLSRIFALDASAFNLELYIMHRFRGHQYFDGCIELYSSVDLPKGSGLGTSSILAFAMLHSLLELLYGEPWNWSDDRSKLACHVERIPDTKPDTKGPIASIKVGWMVNAVLAIEQLMTTGGGWQDQVGGALVGMRLSSSSPGCDRFQSETRDEALPSYAYHVLSFTDDEKVLFNHRIVCVFTGTCRLAKGVCDSVVATWQRREVGVASALSNSATIAMKMYDALSKDNVNQGLEARLAKLGVLLEMHKRVQRELWPSIESPSVTAIYDALRPFCQGTFICGAGSGGHVVGILRPHVVKTSPDVAQAIKSCGLPGARLVDIQLVL